MERFWSKVDKSRPGGCWAWTASCNRRGYGQFRVAGTLKAAHRVLWEQMHGPIPDGMIVCHHCDNPGCVNPDHLFLGTHADNMADKVAKGRQSRQLGESHPRAKLTDADVRAIRSAAGTVSEIAKKFGISRSNVSTIRLRQTWVHVQ